MPRSILKRLAPSFEACSLRCDHLSPDGGEDSEADAKPDARMSSASPVVDRDAESREAAARMVSTRRAYPRPSVAPAPVCCVYAQSITQRGARPRRAPRPAISSDDGDYRLLSEMSELSELLLLPERLDVEPSLWLPLDEPLSPPSPLPPNSSPLTLPELPSLLEPLLLELSLLEPLMPLLS